MGQTWLLGTNNQFCKGWAKAGKEEQAMYLRAALTDAAAASEAGQAEASADPVQPAFLTVAYCA